MSESKTFNLDTMSSIELKALILDFQDSAVALLTQAQNIEKNTQMVREALKGAYAREDAQRKAEIQAAIDDAAAKKKADDEAAKLAKKKPAKPATAKRKR